MIEIICGKMLYTGKEVMSRLITLKTKNSGLHINNEMECASELFFHWINCNVYPITIQGIAVRIKNMSSIYDNIRRYDTKNKTPAFWMKYNTFLRDQNELFDIKENYQPAILDQETFWGVDEDTPFYVDQKGPRTGYCTRNVDPKWRKTHERRVKDKHRVRNEPYEEGSFAGVELDDDVVERESLNMQNVDEGSVPSVPTDEREIDMEISSNPDYPETSSDKTKYQFVELQEHDMSLSCSCNSINCIP